MQDVLFTYDIVRCAIASSGYQWLRCLSSFVEGKAWSSVIEIPLCTRIVDELERVSRAYIAPKTVGASIEMRGAPVHQCDSSVSSVFSDTLVFTAMSAPRVSAACRARQTRLGVHTREVIDAPIQWPAAARGRSAGAVGSRLDW